MNIKLLNSSAEFDVIINNKTFIIPQGIFSIEFEEALLILSLKEKLNKNLSFVYCKIKWEQVDNVISLIKKYFVIDEKIEKELRACFMSNDFNPDKLIQKIITIISHNKLRFEGIEIQSCSYTTWGLLFTDARKFFKNMRKFKNKEVFTIKIR